MQLQGKTVLVTGGGRRLGRAIALALAEGGANILLHVHTSSGLDVVRDIEALGRRVGLLQADLSTSREVLRLAKTAMASGSVDVLVNNAAVFFPTPLLTITAQAWREVIQTNLTAPFLLAFLLGRAMVKNGAGKIIQLGDWSGERPVPDFLPYCVSKGGARAMTRALAKTFAPQVQVNMVAPGPVQPPEHYDECRVDEIIEQTPLKRLGCEHDIARAVRFLVESGDFVTGATYTVDGGWLSKVAGGRGISL